MIGILRNKYELKVIKKDGCWGWNGSLIKGYARLTFRNKFFSAHRVSWMIHKGEIPKELCVLHSCDNRDCTNIDHLFLGTFADNYQDMKKKGRLGYGAIGNNFTSKPNKPRKKLTDESVSLIRELLRSNELSIKEIANRFLVSISAIYNIKTNRRWGDVQ